MLALYDHVRRLGRTRRRLRSAAERRARAGRRIGSRRRAAARADAIPVGGVSRLRGAAARRRRASTNTARARGCWRRLPRSRLRHVVVAIGDRPFDPDGFWPADVALLTTIAGLERSTSSRRAACSMRVISIACGWRSWRSKKTSAASGSRPPRAVSSAMVVARLRVTAPRSQYRDREDELEGVARRIKADRRRGVKPPLDRIGLVVARPLPYLYLAREVFAGAGIPYEALDTLPLAAEPYAAAVDVVLECAAANFTRRAHDGAAAIAALSIRGRRRRDRSRLDRGARRRRWPSSDISAASIACARSAETLDRSRTSGRAAPRSAAATTLAPLLESRPMVDQVELLRAFLDAPRSRASTIAAAAPARPWCIALDGLIAAYRRHDPVRDRHRHRAVRRDPPLARHADVRGRDRPAAASASSTRKRRGSPIWTTCRSWGWSKASGPSASAATCSIRDRSSPQLEPSRPGTRRRSTRSAIRCDRRARCFAI